MEPAALLRSRWTLYAGLAAIVIAAAMLAMRPGASAEYVTAPVDRGPIERTITASGSVNPEVTVQVGAFISGTINALYCDFNTRVRKGQLCAKIDPQPYQTALAKARADLQQAHAQLAKDKAGLDYATLNLSRMTTLLHQDSIARDAYDNALNARNQASAQVKVDESAIRQSEAGLNTANINLSYTNIVSPVDGTVVSRNVNVGQTVASSFQTPTLFLIANDLKRMQVDANVSESDIGGVTEGERATFSVEAYPDRKFEGRVAQVRQAPLSVQNVITYDVVIAADNSALLLKPGMTAQAHIVVAEAGNVLRVPVRALQFSPPGARMASEDSVRVWVLEAGRPRAVPVTPGIDDDSYAEIRSGALKVGDKVIVSARTGGERNGARPQSSAAPRLGF